MKALIGTKLGMTQIIGEDGITTAVTLVQAGPMTVTGLKTEEKDGYVAAVIGFGENKKPSKAIAGQTKASKSNPKVLKEVRNATDVNVGDSYTADVFETGDSVQVTGTSKGKGFAGTVKRWNFKTSAESHGGNGVVRRPGSIGSMYPQKIFKGKKMAGRLGHEQVTVKNLKVALIDTELNIIGIKGAVPGPKKGTVFIKGML